MSEFNSLLVEKYRPQTIEDMVLQDDVKQFITEIQRVGEIPHILLCSAPGSGKTSLAKCIPKMFDCSYRYMNASDQRGIDAIRDNVISYAQTKSFDGKKKIFILDEMDGLTGEAQRALRNTMEEYAEYLRFILTANYKSRITKPIKSRTILFELVPPIDACIARVVKIIKAEGIKVPKEEKSRLQNLIHTRYPDLRQIISGIQQYTKDGILQIPLSIGYTNFAKQVLQMILENETSNSIRKFVIEHESEFNADYHNLLKGLFESVFETIEDEDKKRRGMLTCGRYMESHQHVMDFEINCFCCILNLLEILT